MSAPKVSHDVILTYYRTHGGSHRVVAAALGVSKETVRKVLRQAGIPATRGVTPSPVPPGPETPQPTMAAPSPTLTDPSPIIMSLIPWTVGSSNPSYAQIRMEAWKRHLARLEAVADGMKADIENGEAGDLDDLNTAWEAIAQHLELGAAWAAGPGISEADPDV